MSQITVLMKYFMVLALIIPTATYSHSGRLNSQGCHAGKQPYHCHRSSSEITKSSSGGYRLKCSSGSRSKDCSRSSKPARNFDVVYVQRRLVYHCSSIGTSFIDGKWGQNSERMLRRFQTAYGLKADGIVGANTMRRLKGVSNRRCR